MTIRTISEAAFDAHPGDAQKASEDGPVIITKDDRPAYALVTYDTFLALGGKAEDEEPKSRPSDRKSILDLLYDPAAAEIDFEIPKLDP